MTKFRNFKIFDHSDPCFYININTTHTFYKTIQFNSTFFFIADYAYLDHKNDNRPTHRSKFPMLQTLCKTYETVVLRTGLKTPENIPTITLPYTRQVL